MVYRTTIGRSNAAGLTIGLMLLIVGFTLIVLIPVIGWIIGAILVVVGLLSGGKRKHVLMCGSCRSIIAYTG
jgi:phosphotransferase system  glucose/maltose/N-acetylglucosamine-specific IIC component